jgi:hypothetical protein
MTSPRGIRNHNPGNIRWGDKWQGLVPQFERTDAAFCQFIDPTWGIRALARVLINYQDKHGLNTVRKIIARWAPPNENNTPVYVEAVCKITSFGADEPLDLHRYEAVRPLVEAIIRHECGRGPAKTRNTWYDAATVDAGLRLAGMVKPAQTFARMPVTKETVGASATATIGLAQIADAGPILMDAMDKSEAHLSSGSIVRIVFGVATIAVAVYIAWSQVKKYQQGVVA